MNVGASFVIQRVPGGPFEAWSSKPGGKTHYFLGSYVSSEAAWARITNWRP